MSSPASPYLLDPSIWGGKVFNGEWVAPASGVFPVTEPATGASLGAVGRANEDDVRQAARSSNRGAEPPCGRGWRSYRGIVGVSA